MNLKIYKINFKKQLISAAVIIAAAFIISILFVPGWKEQALINLHLKDNNVVYPGINVVDDYVETNSNILEAIKQWFIRSWNFLVDNIVAFFNDEKPKVDIQKSIIQALIICIDFLTIFLNTLNIMLTLALGFYAVVKSVYSGSVEDYSISPGAKIIISFEQKIKKLIDILTYILKYIYKEILANIVLLSGIVAAVFIFNNQITVFLYEIFRFLLSLFNFKEGGFLKISFKTCLMLIIMYFKLAFKYPFINFITIPLILWIYSQIKVQSTFKKMIKKNDKLFAASEGVWD